MIETSGMEVIRMYDTLGFFETLERSGNAQTWAPTSYKSTYSLLSKAL